MARQTKPFWVGLFVVSGLVLVVAVLIYLGATNWMKAKVIYLTYFDTTVQGLNLDAPVKFRGVQVGRVKKIAVAPDGNLVEVMMELDPVIAVTDSLRAKLELTGITGMRYIELDNVGLEKQLLHPELTFKPAHPVIPSVPGGFEEIEQALRDIYDKIDAIDTEGISFRTKELLEASTTLATSSNRVINSPQFTAWLSNLNNTITRADSMLSLLRFGSYDSQIADLLKELKQGAKHFNQFCSAMQNEADSLRINASLDTTFKNLNAFILNSNEIITKFHYQSAGVLNNINTTVIALNETVNRLNALIMALESYPSNLLYTAPPPKEK